MGKKIKIMETAIRDGQQSLIATRMPFEDMEPALALMDEVLTHVSDSSMKIRGKDSENSVLQCLIHSFRCCSEVRTFSVTGIILMT